MGQVVHESLGKRAYTITFTAYGGKSANPRTSPQPLSPPEAESVETLFHAAGMPYALVDFRGLPEGHWLRSPMVMRPLGSSTGKQAVVVVTTPGNKLLGTLILSKIPVRFQHTHPF